MAALSIRKQIRTANGAALCGVDELKWPLSHRFHVGGTLVRGLAGGLLRELRHTAARLVGRYDVAPFEGERAEPAEISQTRTRFVETTDDTEDFSKTSADDEIEQVTARPQIQQRSLQAMADDIVKQLLPELEQKLRFLLQQALADRLTEDSIKKED